MKFTLKDYQDDAVKDVLVNLKKAQRRWHEDRTCLDHVQTAEPN